MTNSEARDSIFAQFRSHWDQSIYPVLGVIPTVLWQGQENSVLPSNQEPFVRATVLHASGRQATLAGPGGARWERRGICIIQCFGPIQGGKGLTLADRMAAVAKDAFEGRSTPEGVWFRNCRLSEVGPADGWFQMNVAAEFTYDEVK